MSGGTNGNGIERRLLLLEEKVKELLESRLWLRRAVIVIVFTVIGQIIFAIITQIVLKL